MRPLCAFLALAILPGLLNAAAEDKGGKKGKNLVNGVVVSVQKDGDKVGSITVKLHRKKNDTSTAPEEKTIKVSATTTFELVQGNKGAVEKKPSDFSAIEKGSHVLVYLKDGDASEVKIVKKTKGKKKTDA